MNTSWLSIGLVSALMPTVLTASEYAHWPTNALTLSETLEIAVRQNPSILKGRQDIEEAYGISLQLRSAALPKVTGSGGYTGLDRGKIERVYVEGGNSFAFRADESWSADLTISQTLLDGGKMRSSLRSAKLTKEVALRNYEALVSDTLLNVRVAYDDVLLDAELIVINAVSLSVASALALIRELRLLEHFVSTTRSAITLSVSVPIHTATAARK